MTRACVCPEQSYHFETKAPEELYNLQADPHEVHNLASDPQHQDTLERMRAACREWMLETKDAGLLPEHELRERARDTTVYEMLRDPKHYPVQRCFAAATLANTGDAENIPRLLELLEDNDAAIRFWAAVGLLGLARNAKEASPALNKALANPAPDVRSLAAEALCVMGEPTEALAVLEKELHQPSPFAALRAAEALAHIGETARPVLVRYTSKKRYDTNYRDEQFAPQDVLRHAMTKLNIPLPDAVKVRSYEN